MRLQTRLLLLLPSLVACTSVSTHRLLPATSPVPLRVGRVTCLDRPLARIQRRSETTGWAPHDLRRSVASHMTGMGIPRLVVGKILNHAEPGVTKVYDRHSYDPEKRQALDAWARRLHAIVTGEAAAKVVELRRG